MRLNQFLSKAGAAPSRRKADELIQSGRVKLNGKLVTQLATKVDPESDKVSIGKKAYSLSPNRLLVALHKPAGYTTTRQDPHADRVVYDLLPESVRDSVHSIGRLDKDTSGLLLFTNDGEITQRLTHPSYRHEKEYELTIKGSLSDGKKRALENGVQLEDGRTARAKVSDVQIDGENTRFALTIIEGKKRQIRRMCLKLHINLQFLHRIRVGPFLLGNLPNGKWRFEDPSTFHTS